MSAAEAIATFRADAASLVVAVVLVTLGAGMLLIALLSAPRTRGSFIWSGVFSALYGIRLLLNTSSFAVVTGAPGWLRFARADLEYLVPIPAALLFQAISGERWRVVHRFASIVLAVFALVAIPYEHVTRSPFAAHAVINVLVIALIVVFAVAIFAPRGGEEAWSLIRIGAVVFTLFVANEHAHVVHDRYGISREPVGMLFLMLTIVYSTMHRAAQAQQRLAAVDAELATARTIQRATLPRRSPRIAGLDVTATYEAASEVAGDFYDFLELPDGTLTVFIADVSGHGVPAALVASMLKIAVATQAEHAAAPARILASLNALFTGRLERQFITAGCVHVDPAAGVVRVASAGHPPPMLRRASGEVEELIAAGVVLGRFRNVAYDEITLAFEAGDTLVLYTDGLTETANAAGEQWGDERLAAVIARDPSRIVDETNAWRGRATPEDDVTLVVVRRIVAV